MILFTTFQFLLADRYHDDMTRGLQLLVWGVLNGHVKGYMIPRDVEGARSGRRQL